MPTPKQFAIGSFAVILAGVVGATTFPTAEEVILQPNEIVQEVKAEVNTNIPVKFENIGGKDFRIEYMKTYRSADGATADTPKAGYTLVTDRTKMVTRTTIVETAEEKADREAEQAAIDAANEIKSHNESIYRRIGDALSKKAGKQSVGVPTTQEDAEITRLKGELQ